VLTTDIKIRICGFFLPDGHNESISDDFFLVRGTDFTPLYLMMLDDTVCKDVKVFRQFMFWQGLPRSVVSSGISLPPRGCATFPHIAQFIMSR